MLAAYPPCVGTRDHGPLDRMRLRLVSALASWTRRARFRDLRTFVIFVGYPRSGHTLVGALLDAHPHAVISHELDAVRLFGMGFSYRQVANLVLENARQFAAAGRLWEGYSYDVPGASQGRAEPLLVLGDKKGGQTTARLGRDPGLLDRIDRRVPVPVKLVHVVRNPFDVVATRHRRTRLDPDVLVDDTVALFDAAAAVTARAGADRVLTLRHEDVVADPRASLASVARFLGLEPDASWLGACAGVVRPSPNRSRHAVPWTAPRTNRVRAAVARHAFLEGYELDR